MLVDPEPAVVGRLVDVERWDERFLRNVGLSHGPKRYRPNFSRVRPGFAAPFERSGTRCTITDNRRCTRFAGVSSARKPVDRIEPLRYTATWLPARTLAKARPNWAEVSVPAGVTGQTEVVVLDGLLQLVGEDLADTAPTEPFVVLRGEDGYWCGHSDSGEMSVKDCRAMINDLAVLPTAALPHWARPRSVAGNWRRNYTGAVQPSDSLFLRGLIARIWSQALDPDNADWGLFVEADSITDTDTERTSVGYGVGFGVRTSADPSRVFARAAGRIVEPLADEFRSALESDPLPEEAEMEALRLLREVEVTLRSLQDDVARTRESPAKLKRTLVALMAFTTGVAVNLTSSAIWERQGASIQHAIDLLFSH